jgi:hypothetical protein
LSTTASNSKNPIARLPFFDALSDFRHFAGEFHAGNVFRRTGWRRIPAHTLKNVGAIQTCCTHTDEYVIRSRWLWGRNVPNFQYLNTAWFGDNSSFHRVFISIITFPITLK